MNGVFKKAWDDYNKSSQKKKVLMDQINILSVKKIEDGIVYLHEISPMLLSDYPYKVKKNMEVIKSSRMGNPHDLCYGACFPHRGKVVSGR